ncbi:hypothetical protein ABW21_db0203164 [Orbilia brochopaga]|nr:hypothetical protein ABW21_db0203164 [Drechslerella brochopaga]
MTVHSWITNDLSRCGLIQDPDDFASPEEIADMNGSIESLKERTVTLKSKLKALQVTLQTLRSLPTADDLESQLEDLRQEVTDLRNRLEPLRSGDVKPVSAEEKQRLQTEVKRLQGLWVARRKWEKEFFDAVSDGMGDVNPKDLKVRSTPEAPAGMTSFATHALCINRSVHTVLSSALGVGWAILYCLSLLSGNSVLLVQKRTPFKTTIEVTPHFNPIHKVTPATAFSFL